MEPKGYQIDLDARTETGRRKLPQRLKAVCITQATSRIFFNPSGTVLPLAFFSFSFFVSFAFYSNFPSTLFTLAPPDPKHPASHSSPSLLHLKAVFSGRSSPSQSSIVESGNHRLSTPAKERPAKRSLFFLRRWRSSSPSTRL